MVFVCVWCIMGLELPVGSDTHSSSGATQDLSQHAPPLPPPTHTQAHAAAPGGTLAHV